MRIKEKKSSRMRRLGVIAEILDGIIDVIEVIADNVQFLERREQVENEEMDIPPFDDVAPAENDNKNLDSIEITDDDLPF